MMRATLGEGLLVMILIVVRDNIYPRKLVHFYSHALVNQRFLHFFSDSAIVDEAKESKRSGVWKVFVLVK